MTRRGRAAGGFLPVQGESPISVTPPGDRPWSRLRPDHLPPGIAEARLRGSGGYPLKAEFVNPFLSAAFHVLEQEIRCQVKKGVVRVDDTALASDEVTVLVGVAGEVKGVVMYCMTERTAKAFVAAMTGETVPVFDKVGESAVAEMGNVITGLASGLLEKAGYRCNISPPSVITGRGVVISTVAIKRLIIPLETAMGSVIIHVALQEQRERK